MKLTNNFSKSEFLESRFYDEKQQKKVYSSFDYDPKLELNLFDLAENLQIIRDYINEPISINISFRPKWYELEKGRSGNSKHTLAMAADIAVKGITPQRLYTIIEDLILKGEVKEGGLGLYNTFVHYDIRGTRARWGK